MISIRWAHPEERNEIQTYLFENMGKISRERWRNILDCRWNTGNDHYGIVAHEQGKLVGFLGIVFADRMLSGTAHRIGNITSWFLEKHLRRSGIGQEMLALITEAENVTYTALSANFRSGALLKKIGWELLEDTRLFWHRETASNSSAATIISGAEALKGKLKLENQQMVADHEGLNLTPHLLCNQKGSELFFFSYVKIKGDEGKAYYEILYADDHELLTDNIAEIASLLLPDDKSVLSSDKRLLRPNIFVEDSKPLSVSRYFKPARKLNASQVDFLYSEVVLLDLKIY